ncbi:MAG TPA: hypothetical protein DD635_02295, partial [Flavobacteriales bacterium]|nr:hypothetical protein [Flavobacteriales bacterium]
MKLPFRILILIWLFFCNSLLTAQAQRIISGTVTDASSGEQILGASIVPGNNGQGTSTNMYGFYSLKLAKDIETVAVSFIGYKTSQILLKAGQSVYNIGLEPAVIAFEEAKVISERKSHTSSTDVGRASVEVDQIKALPALLGEVDVLKVLQFLPGVSSAGDGNSGFYVRGGGPDQNLILLDDATVYNASHLFGFFSVFNA